MFDLPAERVRVFCERVGGGFGGKQEMLTEDIVALAVLRTGRPVRLEFTRQEQFMGAPSRHPMRMTVTLGATRDGLLTTMQLRVVSNAGAYGNHSGGVLYHGCGECHEVYRCANKQIDGYAVYTNTLPSGAFRGYGLSQTVFAVESAMDELARKLGIDPFTLRRRNIIGADTEMHGDVEMGSYGLTQCLDLVEAALGRVTDVAPPDDTWRVGEGIALAMIHTIPPRGHFAEASIVPVASGGYELTVGTAEFGNGTTTVHAQIAASVLGTVPSAIRIRQSDTALIGHDTGAYGSTGSVVAGKATERAAAHLRDQVLALAADRLGVAEGVCRLVGDVVTAGALSVPVGSLGAVSGAGRSDGSPRSVAFNVHGFRVAVQPGTGEIRILHSVQAADAGRVINPMQCRGQVEGGTSQAIGAALYEDLRIDAEGRVENPTFRGYHIPAWADLAAHRGAVRRYGRPDRAVWRQVHERESVQPGGAGTGQCGGERDGGADQGPAASAGPGVPGAGRIGGAVVDGTDELCGVAAGRAYRGRVPGVGCANGIGVATGRRDAAGDGAGEPDAWCDSGQRFKHPNPIIT